MTWTSTNSPISFVKDSIPAPNLYACIVFLLNPLFSIYYKTDLKDSR